MINSTIVDLKIETFIGNEIVMCFEELIFLQQREFLLKWYL